MKQEEEPITGLPENAFRELKPGEVYNPLMSPDKKYSEVNAWSVTWGILMAILFSAAAAYLGLKVGQVFEAAIPIAIICCCCCCCARCWRACSTCSCGTMTVGDTPDISANASIA